MNNFINKNKNIHDHVIVGDANIDTLINSDESLKYLNIFFENGYNSYINGITRYNPNNNRNGSCIDHFMVKSDSTIHSCKFIDKITDHYPVFISINNQPIFNNEKFYRINYNQLIKLCYKTDWNDLIKIKDTNTAIVQLIEKINSICDLSKKLVNKNSKPRQNWITPAIIISCNKKRKLYNLYKSNPDNNEFKNNYINYQNRLKYIINYAKIRYENYKVKNSDSKGLWNFINTKLNKSNKKIKI